MGSMLVIGTVVSGGREAPVPAQPTRMVRASTTVSAAHGRKARLSKVVSLGRNTSRLWRGDRPANRPLVPWHNPGHETTIPLAEGKRMDIREISTIAIDAGTRIGLKILGAIVLWVVGRMLIGFLARMAHNALERQRV